jgi:hypothetical protein
LNRNISIHLAIDISQCLAKAGYFGYSLHLCS